jgi:16S rRNA (guanine527-N7)-methyltransferase
LSAEKFAELRAVLPDVSRETFERLLAFEALFKEWNTRINLASAGSIEHLWQRHILDSAQLGSIAPMRGTWIDAGSGGGFPGIVLAVLLNSQPNVGGEVHLIESTAKKAGFLKAALAACGGAGAVHTLRIEDAPAVEIAANYVSARALAPLPDLLKLTSPWLQAGARGFFHKGRRHKEEISAARGRWRFDLLEHQSKTDADSVILEISNVSQFL